MKAFQMLALPLQRQNAALGQQLQYQAIQDSYTAEFLIAVEGVIGTAAATATVEGLPAIINKVSIQGPLTGYAPLTPINNLSGGMLAEMAQFIRANVSYSFGSLASTGAFAVMIPCTFIHARLPQPWRYMSCLPTNLMGSCSINVTVANQIQLDTNATPTLVFSSLNIYVQQNEFKNSTIPAMSPLVPAAQVPAGSFQFIPSTLNYVQNLNLQAGQQQQQLFPNGTYLAILLRSFTATTSTTRTPTARQTDGTAGPIDTSITSQGLVIQDVNQNPKASVDWYTLRSDNLNHVTDSLVAGNGCFQFNQGLSSIFQPQMGPNQIPLLYPVVLTGTTNPRLDFVYMQIFDTMNWLNLV